MTPAPRPKHKRQGRRVMAYAVEGERPVLVTVPNTPPTLLGARLRELREREGMRQGDLAPLLNTLPNRVSDWELGIVQPSLPILLRYAQAFDTTVAHILDGVM